MESLESHEAGFPLFPHSLEILRDSHGLDDWILVFFLNPQLEPAPAQGGLLHTGRACRAGCVPAAGILPRPRALGGHLTKREIYVRLQRVDVMFSIV
jgi:hypothetical protein